MTEAKQKVREVVQNAQSGGDKKLARQPGQTLMQSFEATVNMCLNEARNTASKAVLETLSAHSNAVLGMVLAGSKGSDVNIAQIIACVGQQNVEGKRIPCGFKDRTLPHWTKYDMGPQARGFVENSYLKGLTGTEDMRFYSITSKMPKMASSKGKPLVIQFSAKVQNHQYAYCGGGYIKLLPDKADYSKFSGDDEYNVMFGPDLCGYVVACARARAPRSRARGGGVRRARPCLRARRAPSCPLVAALGGPSAAPPSRSSCAARSPAPVACASGASRVRSYDVSHIHAIFNHKGKNLLKSEKVSLEFSR
jgi:hypothetical protein